LVSGYGVPVVIVDGVAESLADEANEAAGLVEPHNVFEFPRQFADQGPKENVAIEGNGKILERVFGFHVPAMGER
jgi:hypothetical protein